MSLLKETLDLALTFTALTIVVTIILLLSPIIFVVVLADNWWRYSRA